jgi:Flp pilus assembly protein TadG
MLARRRARRPGSAVVEFAMVLPVFLLFLFALIEIGRTMMTASLLTEAARTGCRAGVLPSADNGAVNAAVNSKVGGLGLGSPEISIQVNGKAGEVATAQTRDGITVAVAVDYADVTWLPFARWVGGKVRGQFSLPRE